VVPEALSRFGPLLERKEPLRLTGTVDVAHACVSLVVREVRRVEAAE
jgi:hypothetical protein